MAQSGFVSDQLVDELVNAISDALDDHEVWNRTELVVRDKLGEANLPPAGAPPAGHPMHALYWCCFSLVLNCAANRVLGEIVPGDSPARQAMGLTRT
jgi:hypothetical protein